MINRSKSAATIALKIQIFLPFIFLKNRFKRKVPIAIIKSIINTIPYNGRSRTLHKRESKLSKKLFIKLPMNLLANLCNLFVLENNSIEFLLPDHMSWNQNILVR